MVGQPLTLNSASNLFMVILGGNNVELKFDKRSLWPVLSFPNLNRLQTRINYEIFNVYV